MNSRRKRISEEINLTPLLDVLFVILFVVMLSGVAGNKESKAAADKQDKRIGDLETEIADTKKKLTIAEDTNKTLKEFETKAVFITIENVDRNGIHMLELYRGIGMEKLPSITMGIGKTNYIQAAIKEKIEKQIRISGDMPVFIVFHRDNSLIYRREESMPIDSAMMELMGKYKQVFYEVKER